MMVDDMFSSHTGRLARYWHTTFWRRFKIEVIWVLLSNCQIETHQDNGMHIDNTWYHNFLFAKLAKIHGSEQILKSTTLNSWALDNYYSAWEGDHVRHQSCLHTAVVREYYRLRSTQQRGCKVCFVVCGYVVWPSCPCADKDNGQGALSAAWHATFL